jgi:hypothetical protein
MKNLTSKVTNLNFNKWYLPNILFCQVFEFVSFYSLEIKYSFSKTQIMEFRNLQKKN